MINVILFFPSTPQIRYHLHLPLFKRTIIIQLSQSSGFVRPWMIINQAASHEIVLDGNFQEAIDNS